MISEKMYKQNSEEGFLRRSAKKYYQNEKEEQARRYRQMIGREKAGNAREGKEPEYK